MWQSSVFAIGQRHGWKIKAEDAALAQAGTANCDFAALSLDERLDDC